jgi:carbonic anhydrase/acetyltransferase-like protein (isoleucine patch superfamily)
MSVAQGQVLPISEEFRVDVEAMPWPRPPAMAIGSDGRFVVVWDGGSSQGVQGRRFDGAGRASGPQFRINDSTSYEVTPAPVAMHANGDFVTAWTGPSGGVKARLFDSSGSPRDSGFRVTQSAYWGLSLATGAGGGFVVAWSDYSTNLSAELYDGSGRVVRSEFRMEVAGASPEVAMDRAGGFVAVWIRDPRADIGGEVVGRRFDAQGDALGGDFTINTHTLDHQYDATVAMAEDRSFVVAWSSHDQDGDGVGVFGQRFDAAGQRVGGEFQINRQTLGNQSEPSVAMGPGGDFFIAWTTADETATGASVVGQYFDRAGRRVGAEVAVSAGSTSSWPSAALAANGTLVVAWSRWVAAAATEVVARRFAVRNPGGGDSDGDSVPANGDNCPTVFNPEQTDVDGDGYGDDCVSPDAFISPNARIGASPVIGRGTTIADGVTIGDDARLGEHVLLDRAVRAGDGLTADDFVSIGRRTTLGDGVTIGFASRIEGTAVIGSQLTIGDRVVIRRNVNIGDGATIEPLAIHYAGARIGAGAVVEMGARIGRGAMVSPGAVVPAGTTVPPLTVFP